MTGKNPKRMIVDPFFYVKPDVKAEDELLIKDANPGDGDKDLEFHPKQEIVDPLFYLRPDAKAEEELLIKEAKPGNGCKSSKFHLKREIVAPLFYVEQDEGSLSQADDEKKKSQKGGIQDIIPAVVQNAPASKISEVQLPMVHSEQDVPANFLVTPLCKFVYVDRNGKEVNEREEIVCAVTMNQVSHALILKTTEIRSLSKIITGKFADAIVDYEIKRADKIIETKFRQNMRFCKREYIYFQAGWQSIGKEKVYVRNGVELGEGRKVETAMTLPSYQYDGGMILKIFHSACNLYRNTTSMFTMLAFSLMGVMYRPFRDAGFAPRFTLFLNGKTGSMKTTIGKILYMQLCEEEFRDNPRRLDSDTAVSLERAIVASGHDTITLIDDFSPAKTEMKKREMQDKLEMIVRMVGDGSSRSRSNLNLDDRRGEGVQGMVVLTGELKGRGVSSNLRCLYCKMEREYVNEDVVTWFQENPYALTTFIATFADFVGQHYDLVVKSVKEKFNDERKRILSYLKERRLVDSAVALCIACDVLRNFLVIYGGMDDKMADEIMCMMCAEIVNCALISQELSTEESPSIAFVQAISSLIRMNQIVFNTEKVTRSDITEYDGFADETFFYFNPDSIHKKVVAFMRQTNRYFPYELNEILIMLAEDKIIKTASNGVGKRTFCVRISVGNGVRHNFLKIRRSIFDAIVEGNFDCEKGEKE